MHRHRISPKSKSQQAGENLPAISVRHGKMALHRVLRYQTAQDRTQRARPRSETHQERQRGKHTSIVTAEGPPSNHTGIVQGCKPLVWPIQGILLVAGEGARERERESAQRVRQPQAVSHERDKINATLTVGDFWVPGHAILIHKPDPNAPQHPRLPGVGLVRLHGVPQLQELKDVRHVLHRRRRTFPMRTNGHTEKTALRTRLGGFA